MLIARWGSEELTVTGEEVGGLRGWFEGGWGLGGEI